MPGAPNRPPPTEAPPPPPEELAGRLVLRRLAAARVALRLDLWKDAPAPDLLVPFERAEAAFAAHDWPNAVSALDLLSVRFAEPRWPTLPLPFRDLRVAIPPPQPPEWDPEHALSAEEKAARRLRRDAELQIALARASLGWMSAHGLPAPDLDALFATAAETFEREGPTEGVWDSLDRIWTAVRARVPPPQPKGRPAPAAPSRDAA